MGLLRLGRADADSQDVDEENEVKRSMQLLRLGRKRNDDDEDLLAEDPVGDQLRRRCVLSRDKTLRSICRGSGAGEAWGLSPPFLNVGGANI